MPYPATPALSRDRDHPIVTVLAVEARTLARGGVGRIRSRGRSLTLTACLVRAPIGTGACGRFRTKDCWVQLDARWASRARPFAWWRVAVDSAAATDALIAAVTPITAQRLRALDERRRLSAGPTMTLEIGGHRLLLEQAAMGCALSRSGGRTHFYSASPVNLNDLKRSIGKKPIRLSARPGVCDSVGRPRPAHAQSRWRRKRYSAIDHLAPVPTTRARVVLLTACRRRPRRLGPRALAASDTVGTQTSWPQVRPQLEPPSMR
jgi:hypothetical protein